MTLDLSKQSLVSLRDETIEEDYISSNIIEIWRTKINNKWVKAAFVIGTHYACIKGGCNCVGSWENNMNSAESQGGISYVRSVRSHDLEEMQ